jgi:hypothetical protein
MLFFQNRVFFLGSKDALDRKKIRKMNGIGMPIPYKNDPGVAQRFSAGCGGFHRLFLLWLTFFLFFFIIDFDKKANTGDVFTHIGMLLIFGL